MNKELESIGKELYQHKYKYYVLCSPVITDYEYDMLERKYKALAESLGVEPEIANMVGFNPKHRYYKECI